MQVKVIKFDDLGQGISKINNKVCFIEKALPEEELEIEVTKNSKDYSKGIIKNILKENKERIVPICKYYKECGGCNFLHTTLDLESKFKINKCINYFNINPTFIKTIDYNYRNKVVLHVKDGNLGYHKERTHDLIKIDYCYLLSNNLNLVIELFNKYKDSNFNGEILIRDNSKEIIVSIDGEYKYLDKLINNSLITNLIYNNKVLKGKDYFIETINNYKFKVHYKSFFQVNRIGLEKIEMILSNFLKDKKLNKVLDLYSGTSVLGIIMSKYAKEVISIEENKYASLDAKENLKLNNITNLEVINSKVEDYIENFLDIDLVLVDPARSGLDKKSINYLKKLKSKYLIYISCEMISLKRDLASLKEIYNIKNIYLVDMFPRTNKVETIMIMER